jgi:hypothetical protein
VFTAPVELISGPAELQVVDNGDYRVRLIKDGKTIFDQWIYYAATNKLKALESIARAEGKNLDKVTDPNYQRSQERKRKARENKNMSLDEQFNAIRDYTRIPEDLAKEALRELRHYVKSDDEWQSLYEWTLQDVDSSCENWASISVQGYGYTTRYTVELDTGYNKYQTTVSKTEGWHTE